MRLYVIRIFVRRRACERAIHTLTVHTYDTNIIIIPQVNDVGTLALVLLIYILWSSLIVVVINSGVCVCLRLGYYARSWWRWHQLTAITQNNGTVSYFWQFRKSGLTIVTFIAGNLHNGTQRFAYRMGRDALSQFVCLCNAHIQLMPNHVCALCAEFSNLNIRRHDSKPKGKKMKYRSRIRVLSIFV